MNKRFKGHLAAVGATLGGLGTSAMAAVPADVTAAIGDMKDDALVVGAAFLVAVIAIAALKLMRSAK